MASCVPEIEKLDTDFYQPATGGRVSTATWDDFEVVRVVVVLRDAAGGVLGCTEPKRAAKDVWYLEVPRPVGSAAPGSVCITAFDRPGNFAVRMFPLPVPAS